ncbi:MAG: Imm10 family immunity protein [Fimbriimonadaceae bacterium]
MEIKAISAKLEDDGYCTVLAFADDAIEPRRYVILQVTNNPSPQDMQLGQGGVHFELGRQKLSGYDLVKAIQTTDSGVLLTIEENAARKAGIDTHLAIELVGTSMDAGSAEEAIKIFKARLSRD